MKHGLWQPPTGMAPEIVHTFVNTHDGPPLALIDQQAALGKQVLVTVEPWGEPRDTSWALRWAKALRGRQGPPVLIRWAHEFNGNWYPWSGDPAGFVTAFRVIGMVLAPQCEMVWCPNIAYPGSAELKPFWPGSDAVDVIGIDGYDWHGTVPFDVLFAPTVKLCRELSTTLPLMVCETATIPGKARKKWIQKMNLSAPSCFEAVVWFNETKERDWRLTDKELAAFFGKGGP